MAMLLHFRRKEFFYFRTLNSSGGVVNSKTAPQVIPQQVLGRGGIGQSYHAHVCTDNFNMGQPGMGMMGASVSSSYPIGGTAGAGAVKCFPTNQAAVASGERSDFTDNDDQLSSGSTPNAKRKGLPGSKRKSSLFSVSAMFNWSQKAGLVSF